MNFNLNYFFFVWFAKKKNFCGVILDFSNICSRKVFDENFSTMFKELIKMKFLEN
jgi:hypothetical protein